MKVYFLRHGETDHNKKGLLIGGKHDPPINEKGEKQSREVAQNLDKIDTIYSSDQKRARQTAKIIAQELGMEVLTDKRIRERNFGDYSGKRWEELPNGEELRERDHRLQYDYREQGGESAEEVKERLKTFLQDLRKNHSDDETLLIVAHEGILRMMYHLQGKDAPKIPSGSLHKFEI